MTTTFLPADRSGLVRPLSRLALAVAAVALVALALTLVLGSLGGVAPPPPKAPFGLGVREAAPSGGQFGARILSLQSTFFQHLKAAVTALRDSGAGLWGLIGLGFAYGVFHAAGPGHGKAVIAGYLVADGRALRRGFGLSLAAALLQALVAITLVGVLSLALRATAATMGRVTTAVELTSFAAVAALGIWVTWRKAGGLLALLGPRAEAAGIACDDGCSHIPPPSSTPDGPGALREMAGIVVAAGLRPCAGALVVLVFALSQGLFAAGIAATLAMALGTALTTGAIAALAVFAKRTALRLAGGRALTGARAVATLELLAAAFVAVVGLALLFGLWAGGGMS